MSGSEDAVDMAMGRRQPTVADWLLCASEADLRRRLRNATVADLEEALRRLEGKPGNNTRRAAIQARLNRLRRDSRPTRRSPRDRPARRRLSRPPSIARA